MKVSKQNKLETIHLFETPDVITYINFRIQQKVFLSRSRHNIIYGGELSPAHKGVKVTFGDDRVTFSDI